MITYDMIPRQERISLTYDMNNCTATLHLTLSPPSTLNFDMQLATFLHLQYSHA